MTTPNSTPDPFDSVRDAFSGLGTSEKAAFVLEATFETIGQALAETGRRAAAIVDDLDIDSWFNMSKAAASAPVAEETPPMATTPAAIKKTQSRKKPSATKPASEKPPSKTAGKPPMPPSSDDPS